MVALTAEELLVWAEKTAAGWRVLVEQQPEILELPCDVRETQSVAGLLQHVVAVELRYAERLSDLPETPYADIPMGSGGEIFATHDRAMGLLKKLLEVPRADWEEEIEFTTRSAGKLCASRRAVFIHLLMHGIRHYAQLATLVREHGIRPGWQMDYLGIWMKQA